jgi:uncharacterized protein (DUF302 family)
MENIGIRARVKGTFEGVRASVIAALQEEGFGILTTIDMKATLKKKLDVEFRRYEILGACNPPFAHKALQAELEVGLMLPCNVIVYEGDDAYVHVTAIDPMQTVAAHGAPALAEIAREVQAKLGRVMGRVAESG